MISQDDLTVIITTFRSDTKIHDCLRSIDKKIKVIVVENSIRHDFKKKIEEQYHNVECILSGSNLGYGKANNLGITKSKTNYVLILNPDAKLDQSTIKNFLSRVKKNPDLSIIGPHIQEEHKIEKVKSEKLIEVDNIKGFAMFLNLSKIKKENIFDENIFIYFEEIDLCKRIIAQGKKIYLDPTIRIYHPGGSSHDEEVNKEMELSRNWHWMWSSFYFHKKYKGFFVALLIVMPKLTSALFKSLFYYFINKERYKVYSHRLSGLINSIIGKKSWYRPKL